MVASRALAGALVLVAALVPAASAAGATRVTGGVSASQLDSLTPPTTPATGHRFPLSGPFTWPSTSGLFGAQRSGHIHQGVDLLAARGVPVVAARGGVVTTARYHSAAGYYVVVDGAGERYDYAYMHLRTGSTRVRVGQRIKTGARIGDVGDTGDAQGTHLHFEIWDGPWQDGGQPIDPLPLLRRWAAARTLGAGRR